MEEPQLKYPLSESEKQDFRNRLEQVLNQTDGEQVIILWDKDVLTDYYQNICVAHLIQKIVNSANEYALLAPEMISLTKDPYDLGEVLTGGGNYPQQGSKHKAN